MGAHIAQIKGCVLLFIIISLPSPLERHKLPVAADVSHASQAKLSCMRLRMRIHLLIFSSTHAFSCSASNARRDVLRMIAGQTQAPAARSEATSIGSPAG